MSAIVEMHGLTKDYISGGGLLRGEPTRVQAVAGVDLAIRSGETLGVVGESGCGKSTLGRLLLRLVEPTAGRVTFDGRDVLAARGANLKAMRRDMQMIFQDPMGSLNPRMKVGQIVGEGLTVHRLGSSLERSREVKEILERVGLGADAIDRYPHEFSGGGHQRIGIARALILKPRFIVADEPVSALDVSIQAQILNLLVELKREFGLTYLFVAHNITAVGYISDRIAVMYLGRVVEVGPAREMYERPLHPYTAALISAVPDPVPGARRRRIILRGDVPSPSAPPSGCRFHTRCWLYERLGDPEICRTTSPGLRPLGEGHEVACHFAEEVAGSPVAVPEAG